MRDFVLHQAEFQDRTFSFPRLRRILRSWLAKRQLRKLSGLDDYLLNDIGLTRDDLRHGLMLPYDVDPISEMTAIRALRLTRGTRHQ